MFKKLLEHIKSPVKLILHKLKWRRINQRNFTSAGNIFPIHKVSVGNFTYDSLFVRDYGKDNAKLIIGNLCSIALDVKFILGGNHFVKGILSYPISPMLTNQGLGSYSKGAIVVGHDCWIGSGALLLSGVTLGNGCVVGAGSVVTKSFPPYSIIGGNPAKLIRMRFSQNQIDWLNTNTWIYTQPLQWYKKFELKLTQDLVADESLPVL